MGKRLHCVSCRKDWIKQVQSQDWVVGLILADSRALGAVWLLRSGEQWLEGDNPVEEGGGRLCRGWFM